VTNTDQSIFDDAPSFAAAVPAAQRPERDPFGLDPHALGAKCDAGKARLSMITTAMPRALDAIARVAEYGARKYSVDGWQLVPDGVTRYTDAMLRHIVADAIEYADPESTLPHAAHAAWNALARLELVLRYAERGSLK